MPCGIYFSLAVLGLFIPGVGSQTRSISMPVCFFKESVHGLVCWAASGINSNEKSGHTSTTACVRYHIPSSTLLYQVILYGFYTDTRLS